MPTQILPAASLRSADRLPAARGLLWVSNRLISIALWSIGWVIFRVASNFLPALREGRVYRRRIDQQPAGGDHRLGAVADAELAHQRVIIGNQNAVPLRHFLPRVAPTASITGHRSP